MSAKYNAEYSKHPKPGEVRAALGEKLSKAELAEMPAIVQRMKDRGLISVRVGVGTVSHWRKNDDD